jgi:hypothetical protein
MAFGHRPTAHWRQGVYMKKRASGIPTGNAGEYYVMAELLRRGFDAQLADRNTKAYDILAGHEAEAALEKVQVKSVRVAPWFVRLSHFEGEMLNRITVYVLIGKQSGTAPVRYFITRNREIAEHVHRPGAWKGDGFVNLKSVLAYENRWDVIANVKGGITVPERGSELSEISEPLQGDELPTVNQHVL